MKPFKMAGSAKKLKPENNLQIVLDMSEFIKIQPSKCAAQFMRRPRSSQTFSTNKNDETASLFSFADSINTRELDASRIARVGLNSHCTRCGDDAAMKPRTILQQIPFNEQA